MSITRDDLDNHLRLWSLVSVNEDLVVTDHQGQPIDPQSVLAVARAIVASYETGVQDQVDKANFEFIMKSGGLSERFINIVDHYDGDWWPDDETRLKVHQMRDEKEQIAMSRSRAMSARKESPQPGYVYLMRNGNQYKIGRSQDVKARQKSLQLSSGFPIELVASKKFLCSRTAEAELHNQYHSKRGIGEWFSLSDADVQSILEAWS